MHKQFALLLKHYKVTKCSFSNVQLCLYLIKVCMCFLKLEISSICLFETKSRMIDCFFKRLVTSAMRTLRLDWPFSQHPQLTVPYGDAPRCGYRGLRFRPVDETAVHRVKCEDTVHRLVKPLTRAHTPPCCCGMKCVRLRATNTLDQIFRRLVRVRVCSCSEDGGCNATSTKIKPYTTLRLTLRFFLNGICCFLRN